MNLEVMDIAGRRMAGIHRRGPYSLISETFVELFPMTEALGLAPGHAADATYVAAYYDDPSQTPADELRSLAAVTVADDAPIGGLSDARMSPGRYVRATFMGPHSELGEAWTRFGALLSEAGYSRRPERRTRRTSAPVSPRLPTGCVPTFTCRSPEWRSLAAVRAGRHTCHPGGDRRLRPGPRRPGVLSGCSSPFVRSATRSRRTPVTTPHDAPDRCLRTDALTAYRLPPHIVVTMM